MRASWVTFPVAVFVATACAVSVTAGQVGCNPPAKGYVTRDQFASQYAQALCSSLAHCCAENGVSQNYASCTKGWQAAVNQLLNGAALHRATAALRLGDQLHQRGHRGRQPELPARTRQPHGRSADVPGGLRRPGAARGALHVGGTVRAQRRAEQVICAIVPGEGGASEGGGGGQLPLADPSVSIQGAGIAIEDVPICVLVAPGEGSRRHPVRHRHDGRDGHLRVARHVLRSEHAHLPAAGRDGQGLRSVRCPRAPRATTARAPRRPRGRATTVAGRRTRRAAETPAAARATGRPKAVRRGMPETTAAEPQGTREREAAEPRASAPRRGPSAARARTPSCATPRAPAIPARTRASPSRTRATRAPRARSARSASATARPTRASPTRSGRPRPATALSRHPESARREGQAKEAKSTQPSLAATTVPSAGAKNPCFFTPLRAVPHAATATTVSACEPPRAASSWACACYDPALPCRPIARGNRSQRCSSRAGRPRRPGRLLASGTRSRSSSSRSARTRFSWARRSAPGVHRVARAARTDGSMKAALIGDTLRARVVHVDDQGVRLTPTVEAAVAAGVSVKPRGSAPSRTRRSSRWARSSRARSTASKATACSCRSTAPRAGRGGVCSPSRSSARRGAPDLRKGFPVGTKLKAKIIGLEEGKMRLSVVALKDDEERAELEELQGQGEAGRRPVDGVRDAGGPAGEEAVTGRPPISMIGQHLSVGRRLISRGSKPISKGRPPISMGSKLVSAGRPFISMGVKKLISKGRPHLSWA